MAKAQAVARPLRTKPSEKRTRRAQKKCNNFTPKQQDEQPRKSLYVTQRETEIISSASFHSKCIISSLAETTPELVNRTLFSSVATTE